MLSPIAMVIAYWTLAGLTAAIILRAFFRDRQARKDDPQAWIFILVAALLWPLTLPSMVASKIRRSIRAQRQSKYAPATQAALN